MSKRKNQSPMTKLLSAAVAVIVLLLAGFGIIDLPEGEIGGVSSTIVQTVTGDNAADEASGPIIEPQALADYIFEHGELPDNFITKREAEELGWDSSKNEVSDVAPGYSIGGDRFGNYEGLLPKKSGRTWYEADCYYVSGDRNGCRIVFSNDGLVYYTEDHYESFVEMKPSGK